VRARCRPPTQFVAHIVILGYQQPIWDPVDRSGMNFLDMLGMYFMPTWAPQYYNNINIRLQRDARFVPEALTLR